jgi:hypothetical protein
MTNINKPEREISAKEESALAGDVVPLNEYLSYMKNRYEDDEEQTQSAWELCEDAMSFDEDEHELISNEELDKML